MEGRGDAVSRGVAFGDGPDAGLSDRGMNVLMTGFPGKIGEHKIQKIYLEHFDLRKNVESVIKLHEDHVLTSRFLVRASSVAEAHRIVRERHLLPYRPQEHGTKYVIRARVIY